MKKMILISGLAILFFAVNAHALRYHITEYIPDPNPPQFVVPARLYEDVAALGGTNPTIYGHNTSDQVVGSSTFYSSEDHTEYEWAFIWDVNNGAALIPGMSHARDINEFGQVAGFYAVPWFELNSALIWDSTNGPKNLGSLGYKWNYAEGLNDFGTVVGTSNLGSPDIFHAFIWDKQDGMKDLNNYLPENSGWILNDAWDINNNGQITGSGTLNGQTRSFLMTPVGSIALPVPWASESYRAYAYTSVGDVDTIYDEDSQESFGPPLAINASAITTWPPLNPNPKVGASANSTISAFDMQVYTGANACCEIEGYGNAIASFTGTYTAVVPYFQFTYAYSGDIDQIIDRAWLTVNDLTIGSILYDAALGAQSSDTISVSTPLGHNIKVRFGLETDSIAYTGKRTNTLSYSAVVVQEPTNPDLVITSLSNPPTSRKRGSSFNVTAKIKNKGVGAADKEFTVGYYLSKNRDKRINKEADIMLTDNVIMSSLVAGASSTKKKIPVNIGNGTPTGRYYVKVCADNRNDIAETNEDNNCRASTNKIRILK